MSGIPEGDLPSAAPEAPERVDGRRQRSARTRQAIVEAYLALVQDNARIPTAEQIARRGRLSERAVFAHFSDLEAVGIAAFDHILAPGLSTPAGDVLGADRASRIAFHVGVRARNCEKWLRLWQVVEQGSRASSEIAQRMEMVRHLIRARIDLIYRLELEPLGERERIATVSAIESLVDFQSWGRLREHYKLSYDDACAAWTGMVDRLLPPTPQS